MYVSTYLSIEIGILPATEKHVGVNIERTNKTQDICKY